MANPAVRPARRREKFCSRPIATGPQGSRSWLMNLIPAVAGGLPVRVVDSLAWDHRGPRPQWSDTPFLHCARCDFLATTGRVFTAGTLALVLAAPTPDCAGAWASWAGKKILPLCHRRDGRGCFIDADSANDRRFPQIQPHAAGFAGLVAAETVIGSADLNRSQCGPDP